MILQLNPQIPVQALNKDGEWVNAQAIGWIDRSEEHHLQWIVVYDTTGEVWITPNPKIRLFYNWSMGRTPDKKD